MRNLRGILLLLCAAALPAGAAAQATTLTVSGLPLTFPQPTGSDFALGYIESAALTTYLLEAAQTGANAQRTAIVSIRALAQSGSAVLQWRRSDLAAWNTLTTGNVDVEQVGLRKGQTWSNAIQWRYLLNWGTTAPGTTTYSIAITLTVTMP